ncbi:hypothetical protein [Nostoc sp. DedQUE04]|uniref:hypothetical protein n=1 Tax=Nostoc sp. DedQUE04 TaxID=3075390 RepID=UPI002AD52694|nr:hypothetical protein [Nostoc sp. DedQUE04]
MSKGITVRFKDLEYEELKKLHFEYCQEVGELIPLNTYMIIKLLAPNVKNTP